MAGTEDFIGDGVSHAVAREDYSKLLVPVGGGLRRRNETSMDDVGQKSGSVTAATDPASLSSVTALISSTTPESTEVTASAESASVSVRYRTLDLKTVIFAD